MDIRQYKKDAKQLNIVEIESNIKNLEYKKLAFDLENSSVGRKQIIHALCGNYLTPYPDTIFQFSNPSHALDLMNRNLEFIGFDNVSKILLKLDYKSFLKTGFWSVVSRYIKEKANYRCQKCGVKRGSLSLELNESSLVLEIESSFDAHHTSYKKHGYESTEGIDDIVCLCRKCHEEEHKGEF
jgi:hypothetical protein